MLQERYDSQAQKIFLASLKDALEIISGKLAVSEGHDSTKRLIAIQKSIEKEITRIYSGLIEPMQEDMIGFAEISHESLFAALNETTALGYAFAGLPKGTIEQIISMDEIRLVGDKGYTIANLFDNARNSQVNRYKQIIAGGLASNDGYKNITKRLIEANAQATTDMSAVVHTLISSATSIADAEAYKAFDDVVLGWESVGVLDSRTSLLCAGLDGRKYFKSNGYKTMLDIPNLPPRHWRCRTKMKAILEFTTDSTRAQNGDTKGQIDKDTNFSSWFKGLSENFQKDYLGKARYDLYKDGRFEIKDFIDIKSGKTFSLSELRGIMNKK